MSNINWSPITHFFLKLNLTCVASKKTFIKNVELHKDVHGVESYLRSLLLLISSGGMVQGKFLGRQSNTSSENSEKSTSYSIRMPSVSGSISPAWPRVLWSWLQETWGQSQVSWYNVEMLSSVKVWVQHSPFCKVAVSCPVGDPTYEQGVGVVARAGSKVFGTVSQENVYPWHPVVHGGEHGERLVW